MSFKNAKGRGDPCKDRRSSVVHRFPLPKASTSALQDKHQNLLRKDLESRFSKALAAAVVCRLGVLDNRTIIGLLGVRPTRSNREEIERWVARQLATVGEQDWDSTVDILCRRLVRTLDRVSAP